MSDYQEFVWNDGTRDITVGVTFHPRRFATGTEAEIDHMEIESVSPARAPLPITETGYKSWWCISGYVEKKGGAAACVRLLLDNEAQNPQWQAYVESQRQGELF